MKLGEALQRRSDNQKRMSELQTRIMRSVVVQEGEKPPEDPAQSLGAQAGTGTAHAPPRASFKRYGELGTTRRRSRAPRVGMGNRAVRF